jgi:hypothetical protein
MVWALTALVALATTYWIALPFLSDRWAVGAPSRGASNDRVRELEVQREGLLRELKDLEFDRRMGKVDEEEYAQARSRVTSEASAVLSRLDRLHGQSAPSAPSGPTPAELAAVEVEVEIAIARARQGFKGAAAVASPNVGWTCSCGRSMGEQDLFCAACGQPRSSAVSEAALA